ncbi:MAG: DUF2971 domain-containing protein [bacterium]
MKRSWTKEYLEILLRGNDPREFIKEKLPKHLFKYCNFQDKNHLDNLRNSIGYLSPADKFNDPYDSRLYASREITKDGRIFDLNNVSDFFQEKIKVASFSASCIEKSLLMWGHYAHYHKGFCIKYDTQEILKLENILLPVIYDDKQFDLTNDRIKLKIEEKSDINILITGLIKYLQWEYEEEWRLIQMDKSDNTGITFEIPKPKAIYLGTKIRPENKIEIAKIAIEKQIPVCQMSFAETGKYELEKKEIKIEELKKLVEIWENTHKHVSSCGK